MNGLDHPIKEIFNADTKGNDKKMKTEKIIDMWYKKSTDRINKEHKKLKEQLINNDKNIVLITKTIDELNNKLKENNCDKEILYPGYRDLYLTSESEKQFQELQNEHGKTILKLISTYKEIKTMVSACETYEQEIEILKSYGVLDKDGKLNIK